MKRPGTLYSTLISARAWADSAAPSRHLGDGEQEGG